MEKKILIKSTALAAGAALVSTVNTQAADLFQAEDLGTGAELRSELIVKNNPSVVGGQFLNNLDIELKCGEGSCGAEKSQKSGEKTKSGEHKCGEGKCGEDKSNSKKSKKDAEENKSGEHKCGEGKCGVE